MENISLYLLNVDHTMLRELHNHGFRIINDILLFKEFYPSETEQRKKLSLWGVSFEHFTIICERIEEFIRRYSDLNVTKSNVKKEDIAFLKFIANKAIVAESCEKYNTMVPSKCITQFYSRFPMGKSDVWLAN